MAKEVKVSSEDVGDDRLGDEEWNIISEARCVGQQIDKDELYEERRDSAGRMDYPPRGKEEAEQRLTNRAVK